jgi:DNA polymerase III sliding clamp (beta) subunit (PCNA family)
MLSITTEAGRLLTALESVRPAVAEGQPLYGAVRLSAKSAKASVEVVGDSMAIESTLSASVLSAGAVVVPLAPLRELAAALPANEVVAIKGEPTGRRVSIDTATVEGRLWCQDPDGFPQWATPRTSVGELTASDIELMHVISFAVEADYQRPVLRGVHVSDGWASATDGYRIARSRLDFDGSLGVLPPGLIKEWQRFGAHGVVRADGTKVALRFNTTKWSASVLSGDYPNLRAEFSKPSTWSLRIDRQGLRDMLRRVAVVGARADRSVHLDPGDGCIQMWSENPEVGRIDARVKIDGGLGVPVCLSLPYLSQAIDGHPAAEGILSVSGAGELAPVIIRTSRVEHLVAQKRYVGPP